MSWYNASWPYRKSITISGSMISGNQTNIPILLRLNDSDISSNAHSGAKDLVITTSDGSTRVPMEIDYYRSGSGSIWFKAPALADSTEAIFYVYYGEGTDHTSDSGYAASGVWDDHYMAVWHMTQDPSQGGACILDSTKYANHGTPGTPSDPWGSNDLVVGKIGQAINWDSDKYIHVSDSDSLSAYISTQITLECWQTADDASYRIVYTVHDADMPKYIYWCTYQNRMRVLLSGPHSSDWFTDSYFATGEWFNNVITYDGDSIDSYSGGRFNDTLGSLSGWLDLSGSSDEQYMGMDDYYNEYHRGKIDELRISNIARSRGWIATCYDNVSSSAFIELGEQSSYSGGEEGILGFSGDGHLKFYGTHRQMGIYTA